MAGMISGMGGASMPQTVSGASKRGSKSHGLADLFKSIDTTGSGAISKPQLQAALGNLKLPSSVKSLGADEIFKKLDPNNTGSVSKQDFVAGLRKLLADLKDQTVNPTQKDSTSPFASLLSGAKSFQTALKGGSVGSTGTSIGSLINTFA
jgi:Ca2+-binding EF-hand superfamily protein